MGCWMSEQPVYTIELDHDVSKQLRRLPRDLTARITKAIDGLRTNPRPVGCKHLVGYGQLYRVRVGDWRIIYEVQDQQLLVLVIEVAARGSAYRGL
jgi:mRNA interferase RelE/StbE